jgi:transcriptional regulator with XRE-family HTH domain
MEFESLTKNLRLLRHLTGLSQYGFAKLAGVSRGRISLVECGHSELSEDERSRAERILRTAIKDRYKDFRSIVECTFETSSRPEEVRSCGQH